MSAYPDAPGHRNVKTSITAADDLAPKLGRLQRLAEATIRDSGACGHAADELAARLAMDRWSIQPRTSELRRKGLIRDSGQRRRNSTGSWPLSGLPHDDRCHAQDAFERAAWRRFETSPGGGIR